MTVVRNILRVHMQFVGKKILHLSVKYFIRHCHHIHKTIFCFWMTCYHITFQSSYIEWCTSSEVHRTSMFILSLLILFWGFGKCGSVLQCQCVGGISGLHLQGQGMYVWLISLVMYAGGSSDLRDEKRTWGSSSVWHWRWRQHILLNINNAAHLYALLPPKKHTKINSESLGNCHKKYE